MIKPAKSNEDLLKKARKSKKIVYADKLDNGSAIIGIRFGKIRTEFVRKIGCQNAGLHPYPNATYR